MSQLASIIAEMRNARSRYKSHVLGFVDSVASSFVDEWADELERISEAGRIAPQAPHQQKDESRSPDGDHADGDLSANASRVRKTETLSGCLSSQLPDGMPVQHEKALEAADVATRLWAAGSEPADSHAPQAPAADPPDQDREQPQTRQQRPADRGDRAENIHDNPRSWIAWKREADRLEAEHARLHAELEAEKAEHTRAILRYTAKGYAAGENADSKAWRERAETAEQRLTALSAAIREVNGEIEALIAVVVKTGMPWLINPSDLRNIQVKLTALLAQETTP